MLAIVRYARRHNDTNNMWLDDMRVFGAEAIYMLARSDIRYAYLVAQFYIPYWTMSTPPRTKAIYAIYWPATVGARR